MEETIKMQKTEILDLREELEGQIRSLQTAVVRTLALNTSQAYT